MESASRHDQVSVFGLGSPHGDDSAGWLVVQLLQSAGHRNAVTITDPMQLLDAFPNCSRAIIVDATLEPTDETQAGRVCHVPWPDARVRSARSNSTHGIGLVEVLELAEQLERLPPSVEIYTIAAGSDAMNANWDLMEVTSEIREAAEALAKKLARTFDQAESPLQRL